MLFPKIIMKCYLHSGQRYSILNRLHAGVVELADALDSKSCVREDVRVRPPPPAPKNAYCESNRHFLVNDVFQFVERDVRSARDVRLRRVMCLRALGNTSHHFAASPQNITMAQP